MSYSPWDSTDRPHGLPLRKREKRTSHILLARRRSCCDRVQFGRLELPPEARPCVLVSSPNIKLVRSHPIEPGTYDGSTCASCRRPRFELVDKGGSGPGGPVSLVHNKNHQLRRGGIIFIR